MLFFLCTKKVLRIAFGACESVCKTDTYDPSLNFDPNLQPLRLLEFYGSVLPDKKELQMGKNGKKITKKNAKKKNEQKKTKKRTGRSQNPGAWSLELEAWSLHGLLVWHFQPGVFFVYYCGMVFLVEEEQVEGVTFAKVGWQCW